MEAQLPQLSKSDNCVSTKEEFNLQEPYVPYTTMVSNDGSSSNNEELMERINYCYLLEEQKNESGICMKRWSLFLLEYL